MHGTAVALVAGLAGCSDGGDGDDGDDGGDGDGTTEGMSGEDTTEEMSGGTTEPATDGVEEITVAPGGSLEFDPDSLSVEVGTTVRWTWDGSGHNVVVESKPGDSDWEGDDAQLYDSGHSHEWTFETSGTYEYYCNPHRGSGMVGSLTVGDVGGGGGSESGSDDGTTDY